MKNQLLILLALALGCISHAGAQNQEKVDNLYRKYSSGDGVFAMSLNHDMLDAIDLDFDWQDQMKNVSGDIHHLKFIAFSEESSPLVKIKTLSSEISRTGIKTIPLPADADVDDLQDIKIYGERTGGYYENVYMLLVTDDGRNGIFLAINGKMKITQAL